MFYSSSPRETWGSWDNSFRYWHDNTRYGVADLAHYFIIASFFVELFLCLLQLWRKFQWGGKATEPEPNMIDLEKGSETSTEPREDTTIFHKMDIKDPVDDPGSGPATSEPVATEPEPEDDRFADEYRCIRLSRPFLKALVILGIFGATLLSAGCLVGLPPQLFSPDWHFASFPSKAGIILDITGLPLGILSVKRGMWKTFRVVSRRSLSHILDRTLLHDNLQPEKNNTEQSAVIEKAELSHIPDDRRFQCIHNGLNWTKNIIRRVYNFESPLHLRALSKHLPMSFLYYHILRIVLFSFGSWTVFHNSKLAEYCNHDCADILLAQICSLRLSN